jgi:Tfp pilus assembly protein PilN
MDIAALVVWIVTALGGFYLLGTWISKGGHRRPSSSRFPPALIFGHFALAAIGLVLWIVYVATDSDALAWIAFIVILVVAVLGFTMLARWIPTYQSRTTAAVEGAPAERHFPVAVVGAHGVLAATTVVLVLLTVIGVGGS